MLQSYTAFNPPARKSILQDLQTDNGATEDKTPAELKGMEPQNETSVL